MGKLPGIRIFTLLTIIFLLFTPALAFDANGGVYDINYGEIGATADSNVNGGVYVADIQLTDLVNDGNINGSTYLAKLGVYFDQNAPVVTISSPSQGDLVSLPVTVTYSARASGNPVARFFLRVGSEAWIDNGVNTSYTFSNLAGSTTYIVTLVATDTYDINSNTATRSFTTVATSQGGSGASSSGSSGGDTGGGGGGGGGPVPQAEEGSTPTHLTIEDLQDSSKIVSKATYIIPTETTPQGLEIARFASYVVVNAGGNPKNDAWSFNVSLTNTSTNTYKNVTVREKIPKQVASNVSQITFREYPARIINPDPEVEWLIEELKSGETKDLTYFVDSLSDSSIKDSFGEFVKGSEATIVNAVEKKEDARCLAVSCDDSNICTEDFCANLSCFHDPSTRNGINCGPNSVCSNGKCIVKATGVAGAVQQASSLLLPGGIIAIVVIVILALIAFFVMRKRK